FSAPSRGDAAQVTVTETVAVPALSQTPLPNALSESTFDPARISDAIDTFRHYNQAEGCSISSLELHGPFEPLCRDRNSLLTAMTEGGRIGFDAPFSPRGCDMRWFSNAEICEILTRFDKVFIVGDSMMRNVAVALHVILRADLINGGRTNWAEHPDHVDCSCSGPFDTSKCSFFSVVSTRVVWNQDPASVSCSREGRGGIECSSSNSGLRKVSLTPSTDNAMLEYPILDEDMDDFTQHLAPERPAKPYAFIMGHGLWNDLEVDMTKAWIDQLIAGIEGKAAYLKGDGAYFPKLFMGPNAAGIRKPEIFLARQGNIAITKFEHEVGPYARRQGFDFIGTYNATIQSNNPDGT
ncbi:MAG: hypothetical protein M1828_003012, partial [Chrysothrix sp. TS-e1954]